MTHGYAWSRIGGHLALDLCNTISWRRDPARTVERLTDPADLADWFRTITDRSAPLVADDHALQSVRRLRAATLRLLDAHVDDVAGASTDVLTVYDGWRAALRVADVPARLPLTATIEPSTAPLLVAHLGVAVAEFLHRPDLSNVRRCDGEGCGWLFLDTTRNHSRRWCDSLDCGNRARVRAYSQRRNPR